MGYLGPVGGLEPVWFTTSEPEEVAAQHTYKTYLSGRRQAQRFARRRRTWPCGMDESLPEDYQVLEQIAAGAYGLQTLVWYSNAACRSNILTPGQSTFAEGTWDLGTKAGGGWADDGTRYLTSQVGSPFLFLADPLAVPAESTVTASAYFSTSASESAMLSVLEQDAMGFTIGSAHQSVIPAGQGVTRASVSFTTSATTATLDISVLSALMVTMPAVTLTESALPWATGRGCSTAMVDLGGESDHFGQVAPDGHMRVTSRSFTITELG